jgi:hypothetical protein
MGNHNRIILVGNLVRDPEVRYVQSGSPVTKFTIAVTRRTKQNDSADDSADYIDVVAWEQACRDKQHVPPKKECLFSSKAVSRYVPTNQRAARSTRRLRSSCHSFKC